MLTDEDRRRLLESRHDLGAAENPSPLTNAATMQAAVAASHADLTAARKALVDAALKAATEKSETDVERLKLQQAVTASIRRYGYIRGKVQDTLLNVDPEQPISSDELLRRQRLFNRVFRVVPSDLERIAHDAATETIGSVAKALAVEPDLMPLGYAQSLTSLHQAIELAAKNLNREKDEDTAAMDALRTARNAVDREASAHALLVESILVRAGRQGDLGRFVLAADAAYAARRAARAPISDEPGIGDVDAEAPAAPAAPGEPPPS